MGDDDWRAFEAAGLSEENALDVVLGVDVLSTFANRTTRAEIDPSFVAFAWRRD